MRRGHSQVFKVTPQRPIQDFCAPFDTLLHRYLSGATLLDATLVQGDRILLLHLLSGKSYKEQKLTLRLEFTGKHSNAILLDENDTVIEALRHIDAEQSYRIVRPGVTLAPLPARPQKEDAPLPEDFDIDAYLEAQYRDFHQKRLEEKKHQKRRGIEKKIATLDKALAALASEEELKKEAQKHEAIATLLLAKLHLIKPYDRILETEDFEGKPIKIALPEGVEKSRMAEHFFNLAKRAKKRAKNLVIERQNLLEKRAFYVHLAQAIEAATDLHTLEILVPKRGKAMRKKAKQRFGELFWIEGHKIIVGRNAKENQAILEEAKANDIWMHVREIPGAHLIIRTDKQQLPDSLLEAAAKLCVDFSTAKAGNYLVDYTKRKFVKLKEGAHVEYDKYRTISILKEGVEIRA